MTVYLVMKNERNYGETIMKGFRKIESAFEFIDEEVIPRFEKIYIHEIYEDEEDLYRVYKADKDDYGMGYVYYSITDLEDVGYGEEEMCSTWIKKVEVEW